jgi:hypothetical protein
MIRILMAVAFAVSFGMMFLGIIIMIHLDLITGLLLLGVGTIYFFKYLPTNRSEYE